MLCICQSLVQTLTSQEVLKSFTSQQFCDALTCHDELLQSDSHVGSNQQMPAWLFITTSWLILSTILGRRINVSETASRKVRS